MANDAVNPIQVQKFLHGVDYPAKKSELIQTAKREGADENVISTLRSMSKDLYDSPTEVVSEIADMT